MFDADKKNAGLLVDAGANAPARFAQDLAKLVPALNARNFAECLLQAHGKRPFETSEKLNFG